MEEITLKVNIRLRLVEIILRIKIILLVEIILRIHTICWKITHRSSLVVHIHSSLHLDLVIYIHLMIFLLIVIHLYRWVWVYSLLRFYDKLWVIRNFIYWFVVWILHGVELWCLVYIKILVRWCIRWWIILGFSVILVIKVIRHILILYLSKKIAWTYLVVQLIHFIVSVKFHFFHYLITRAINTSIWI